MIRKSLWLALLLIVVWLAAMAPALADDDHTVGEEALMWPTALAWLVPIGLGMLACGAVPPDRVAAVIRTGWLALGVSVVGYWLAGFATQFGGVGFVTDHPELAGLAREWTWAPVDATWGPEWGAIGLVGYLLRGPASTPTALRLFLTQLPWITTAVAVPLWSLQGRTGPVVLFLSGLLQGALYALLGNWVWGGGWLANLGLNLGLGHGYVDAMGAGPVHLAGAASALAGMLAFGVRGYLVRPTVGQPPARKSALGQPAVGRQLPLPGLPERASYVPMPALHLPVLATFGAWLAAIGWLGWAISTPVRAIGASGDPWTATWIHLWLAAAGGAIVALCFSWLTTGEGNALMVARGVLGALIAVGPGAPFVPPWAALSIGAGAGLLVPFVQYTIEHLLRFDDPTSAVATHGVPALWGLLAVGLFSSGQAGAGWNRVGAAEYLGVAGQGVSGYLVALGRVSDWPGQFQAQALGVTTIGLVAFVLSWLLFAAVQGLSRAWVGEYTLRLPRRPRRSPSRQSRAWRNRLQPGKRRWPRIHIVRRETPAPGVEDSSVKAPAAKGLSSGAPRAEGHRPGMILGSVERWIRHRFDAAGAAVRRVTNPPRARSTATSAEDVEDADQRAANPPGARSTTVSAEDAHEPGGGTDETESGTPESTSEDPTEQDGAVATMDEA